ncbi:CGNR zinc finger domain-containing protein [Actinomycetospora lemnae]|uniref:CGNR zinc finger domain-containing protein n=1 Tax=Actinomycetospora lemnae TaxID=3019891 RepID=A0ABT5T2H3_9PSEU|nr:CGNR zinc finger domain-containing protein [Actinomycetospora sp. DW7H6]MDD7969322.1 CGNR zinc finger domain-containing protein [Actinomycetospora sp. DW7H6]
MLDEQALIEALNSTPVVDGRPTDRWGDDDELRSWVRAHGGLGEDAELAVLRDARGRLQEVVAGQAGPGVLADLLGGARQLPEVGDDGVAWRLEAAPERRIAVELVLAWSAVAQRFPGRLRPCANPECRLFLLDRSRANSARWCSMKTCGNRLKVRRHHQRHRED